jgi:hypothetical protein
MPCDASFPRWLRAKALAAALVSLVAVAGFTASARVALAQEPAAVTQPAASGAVAQAADAPADDLATGETPATPELASAEPPADTRGLDEEIQNLKKDVVDLNKDLFVLEEELLFPANTQVAVFVSMDVGDFFAIDNVTLKIDQKEVANYLYTPREAEALL